MAVFGFVFSAWYQTTTLRTREWAVSSIARSKAAEYCGNVSRENGPAIHEDENWRQNPRANPSPQSRDRVQKMVTNAVQQMGGEKGNGPKKILGVSRPEFEAMQRNSPNQYLHRKPGSLTGSSKQMAGHE